MSRRTDRDEITGQIETHTAAHLVDGGKPAPDVGRVEMVQRQIHRTVPLRLADDASRHHVARRQVRVGMVARHERLVIAVDQPRPFPADGFGNEKTRRPFLVERGRMKLDELEIGNAGAGVIRERDAVAGGDRRIGGLAKDLAGAACREQRTRRARLLQAAVAIEETNAFNGAAGHEQVGHQRMIDHVDGRQCPHPLPQHAANLAAGGIAGMEHAPHAVSRLAPERRAAALVAIEAGTPLQQLADVSRSLLNQHAHRALVAQPVAGAHGVGGVKRRRIVLTERRRDAALRVPGVAFRRRRFGQDQDAAGGKADRRAQPRHAAADDDEVDDRQKMILGRWSLVIGRWSVHSALRQDRRFSRVLS